MDTKDGIIDLSDRTNMFYWQTDRNMTPEQMRDIFLNRREDFDRTVAERAVSYGMEKFGLTPGEAKITEMGNPIKFGSVNNAVRVTLANGMHIVARFHPIGVKNGYFWVEKTANDHARRAGVPAYETYYIHDTREDIPFDYMLIEALPGKTIQEYWPIAPELDKTLMFETGKYTALIHDVKVKGGGFFLNHVAKEKNELVGQYPSFRKHFFAALENNIAFLVEYGVLTGGQGKKVESIIHGHDDLLKIAQPVLVHNDIADWNEISDGSHVTGIVDWDECFGGDPVMDFVQWSLFFDDNRLKFFKEGYESVKPLPDGYREKEHLYRLRYTVSKLHLRKKRLLVTDSEFMKKNLARGLYVLTEEIKFFGL